MAWHNKHRQELPSSSHAMISVQSPDCIWRTAVQTAGLGSLTHPHYPLPSLSLAPHKTGGTQGAVKPKHTHEASQVLGMVSAASQERAMALLGEFQHIRSPNAEDARVALLAGQAQCGAFTSVSEDNQLSWHRVVRKNIRISAFLSNHKCAWLRGLTQEPY